MIPQADAGSLVAAEAHRLAGLLTAGAILIPGHHAGERVRVRLLGRGATYTAWHLATASTAFLLRIPHRSADAAPRPMRDEFAALQRVPADVGTQGIAFDDTGGNALGSRFLLATFVPGQVKPAQAWRGSDFDDLADALSRLHVVEEPRAGPVLAPSASQVSLVEHLDAGLQWWRREHPELFADPAISELLPALRSAVQRCQDEGGVAARFSLIHGDLIVGNIVTEGQRVGFIDWEWAEFGDVAQDLGYVGGAVHGGPDYVPMTRELIARLVARYVSSMRAAGKETEDVAALIARRDGWELCERFLTMLHTTVSSKGDPAARAGIATVRRTLADAVRGGD